MNSTLGNRVFKVNLKTVIYIPKYLYCKYPKIEYQNTPEYLINDSKENLVSHVSLQVLGCGSLGSPKALYVNTTKSSYLFNCGESTQRVAFENNYKLSKISNVFITTPVWTNIGGLPGFAKTVESSGVKKLFLHGPSGVCDILEAVHNFLPFQTLSIQKPKLTIGYNGNFIFTDKYMKVEYVPLSRKQSKICPTDNINFESINNDMNYYNYKYENDITNISKKKKKIQINLKSGRIDSSTAYICKSYATKNSFNLNKCVDFGLNGEMLIKLKKGENIVLHNGKTISMVDVCSDNNTPVLFIVIDCYDESILESLVKNNSFDRYFKHNLNNEVSPYCIIHFTPENILQTLQYKEWMLKFGTNTKHLILNDKNISMASVGVNLLQNQLNILHPNIFPLLEDEKNDISEICDSESFSQEINCTIYRAKNNDEIILRPLNGFSRELTYKFNAYHEIKELFENEGFKEKLEKFYLIMNETIKALGQMNEYPKLTMLGTGSSIPSKRRNTSGILLEISPKSSIILDCGEGTIMQIFRLFGKEEGYKILSTIKAIYISHLHADHHLGLIGIIQEIRKTNKNPIYLFAPEKINNWLNYYNLKFEDIINDFILMSNKLFYVNGRNSISKYIMNEMYENLEVKEMHTVFVDHCLYSYGLALTLLNDKKIVYSGDTVPCNRLINLGKDCHLLIHEATHEDILEHEAKIKKHSTISQAISVGKQMKAKHILLTHFSQRYTRIPHIVNNDDLNNVGFAFDNMRIRFSELPLLPLFNNILCTMFDEDYKYLELQALKKQKIIKEMTANK